MKFSVSKREIFIIVILSILLGGSSLVGLGNADFPLDPSISQLRYILIGTSLLSLILMSHRYIGHLPSNPPIFIFLWYLFSFVVFLSGYANESLTTIKDGLWFLIAIPAIFFYALPRLISKSANMIITLATFLGTFPYIIASLWLNPFWQFKENLYRGIFANSNQLATSALTISTCMFILIIGNFSAKKSNFLYTLILGFILCSTFILILLANSRTCLIAFFSILFIFFSRLFQKPKHLFIILILSITAITIFFKASEQSPWLWEQIIQIQDKDFLSGRDYIWNKTLAEMKLLGNGSNYFELNFGMGAHNTIISILGINGIIAAFLMICFAIVSFYYAFLHFKIYAKKDNYAIAPLIITTCFWTLSMGEGMFGSLGTGITITYLLSVGVVIRRFNTGLPKKYKN